MTAQPGYAQGFARLPGRRRNHPIHRELRGYWDARLGNTGSTVYDLSGYGAPFTLMATADWTTGPDGHMLSFDRPAGDYAISAVGAGEPPHLEIYGHWTLALRIRLPVNPPVNWPGAFTSISGGGNGLWGISFTTTRQARVAMDDQILGVVDVISNTALNLNQIHDVVGLWDGGNLRVFIDGRLDNTQAGVNGPIDGPQRNVCLACYTGPVSCCTCDIDYAAIWARDLVWSEVMDLHEDSWLLAAEDD